MNIKSLEQAKNTLQSLTESLWIFSALTVLIETGAFTVLCQKTTFNTLKEITKLPESVLKQVVNLLTEAGFLITENENISLATGMEELVKIGGFERITAQVQTTFGLTNDFVKSSRERKLKAGWHHTDEVILQAQGTYSEYIVTDCLPQDTKLHNFLNKSNALFLDVGAGVGKISLQLCQTYNNIKVVALEPAEVPFSLATKNIAASEYQDRIELRKTYLQDLADENLYDVVWFPHVFFADSIFNSCLMKIRHALKPNGILFTGAISLEKKCQSTSVRQLINSLYGGLRATNELSNALAEAGFKDIKTFPEISGYCTITAVKE